VDSVSNSPLSITWDHLGVVRERGEYSRRPQSLPSRPHHISTLRAGGGGGARGQLSLPGQPPRSRNVSSTCSDSPLLGAAASAPCFSSSGRDTIHRSLKAVLRRTTGPTHGRSRCWLLANVLLDRRLSAALGFHDVFNDVVSFDEVVDEIEYEKDSTGFGVFPSRHMTSGWKSAYSLFQFSVIVRREEVFRSRP
jgi:hypothetical protein